ncbi:MAG: hypothetical protein JWM58_1618 [Rhizobium sp.]|nr:hypothetical protein [Rhizobium sp.]
MTKQTNGRKASYIRASVLTALMLLVGGKWYTYVAHADSPFDDFGSSINSIMPGPINRLGCDMLKKRFGDIPIPPKGCNIGGRWA